MLVLLLDQRPEAVFGNSINLDFTGDHLLWLQAAVVEGFDDTGEILLEIAQD